jgi:probable phosphoglycerate mutase
MWTITSPVHRFPPLYLMRHGQTVWNAQGRLQGALDSPLTPMGIRQAQSLRSITVRIEGRCISSPQGRARQTAELAFQGRAWTTDPRLSEIDIGDFAGQFLADFQQSHPEAFQGPPLDWYNHCPNGEGFAALANRCRSFLAHLDGPTLVVTHGITLRMLRVLALARDVTGIAQGEMAQGVVYQIKDGESDTLTA